MSYFKQFLVGMLYVALFHRLTQNNVNGIPVKLVYHQTKETWSSASYFCHRSNSGFLLTRDYTHFDDVRDIVSTDEFWIAESMFSLWLTMDGCYSAGFIEPLVSSNIYISDKMECYNGCKQDSTYFAIKDNYCGCLKPLTHEYQSLKVDPSRCDRQCDDGIGVCGSIDLTHFTVFKSIDSTNEIRMLPNYFSNQGFDNECLARNCYKNHSEAYKCNERLDTVCGGGHETKYMSWTRSLMTCHENHGQHLQMSCSTNDDHYVWFSAFRSIIPDTNTKPAEIEIAVASKCQYQASTNSIKCIKSQDDTKLPFVCIEKLVETEYEGHNKTTTEKPNSEDFVPIAIGIVGGISAFVAVIVVVVVWLCRRKRRRNMPKPDESVYAIPDRIMKDNHVYATAYFPSPTISIYYTGAKPDVLHYETPVQSKTNLNINNRELPQIPVVK